MSFQRAPEFLKNYHHYELPPIDYFVEQNAVTEKQVASYRQLVEQKSGETALDHFIRENKELLVNTLDFVSTGHHGSWVLPQQPIKTARRGVEKGLIPEYRVCGKSSDGLAWWVIEFKGADK